MWAGVQYELTLSVCMNKGMRMCVCVFGEVVGLRIKTVNPTKALTLIKNAPYSQLPLWG